MKNQTILIIEDDKWLSEHYSRTLSRAGYKVATSANALAAIEAIDDVNPSVIILDILLTGNTAFALLHEIQSYGDIGNIPVILCTNLASELSLTDLSPYGVQTVLDKTKMNPKDLIIAVESLIK